MEERYTNGECFTFHGISSGIKKIYLRQITKSSPTFCRRLLIMTGKTQYGCHLTRPNKSPFMLRAHHHSFMHTNVNPCAHGIHKRHEELHLCLLLCTQPFLWILQDKVLCYLHCTVVNEQHFVSLCRTIVNYGSAFASFYQNYMAPHGTSKEWGD